MLNRLLIAVLLAGLMACKSRSYPTQAHRQVIDTAMAGIGWTNDFNGARMNSLVKENDSTFTIAILPENKPINPSPWFAFKLWSSKGAAPVYIKLHYTDVKHRYVPKTSADGKTWTEVSAVKISADKKEAIFKVQASADTLIVAAQELMDSESAYRWVDSLANLPHIRTTKIGKSVLGKPIVALSTTGSDGKKLVVVLSRQHPPEVSGYLAMQEFVRSIAAATPLAERFRQSFEVVVMPMLNPDGVDGGNWRHNVNGVDLNRDWDKFIQPETRAVSSYLLKKVARQQAKVYFGLDFHSTYYDIFYTNEAQKGQTLNSNLPGFTVQWLAEFEKAIPGFKANVKPSGNGGNVSKSWMSRALGAEALTYEVGDTTSRADLKLKGRVAAEKMMELLLEKVK